MAPEAVIGNDDHVPPRYRPLLEPPIGFAHRGARAHERDNTIAAFELALRLGATGLETDVWLTADGAVVLDHDGITSKLPLVKRRFRDVEHASLPAYVPTLTELFESCGTDYHLSIDIKDADAAPAVIEVVERAAAGDDEMFRRVWLCHPSIERLTTWKDAWPHVRFVNSIRLPNIDEGIERRAARLAAARIDAMNMHYSDWSAGLTALFHRFDVLAFGWDAQHERVLAELVDIGIDAVYSDHVDTMKMVLDSVYGDPASS